MALKGVRVGPLDPDGAESFGQINGATSARQLIRHHGKMYPAALTAAFVSARHEARSGGDSIDRAEVIGVLEEELPEGAIVTGMAVRGEDDSSQYLTYTWHVPPPTGTGRTTKGAIPYNAELLPESVKRGDEAAQIAQAKAAGLPYMPQAMLRAMVQVAGGSDGSDLPTDDAGIAAYKADADKAKADAEKARDEALAERDDAQKQLAELADRIAALETAPTPEQAAAAPVDPEVVPEPYDGYEGENADVVKRKLKESGDKALAERVLAYERANAGRAGVISAADVILDRASE